MNNHITASVEFYYKGEKFTSSVELDLDKHIQNTGNLPALYPLLAQAIDLDFYSYEYEMMQAETIIFNNARGLATEHLNEGMFDFESFGSAWAEAQTLQKLQEIAQRNLSVNDIQQRPELKNALLEAYQLGAGTAQIKK